MRKEIFVHENINYCVHIANPQITKSIIALHGFTGSGEDFAPIAEALSFFSFYAPDFLGHGGSEAILAEEQYSLEKALLTLNFINKRFILNKSILLGYSMGGRIALHWAKECPHLFSALVLIGASPGIKDLEEAEDRIRKDKILADEILKFGVENFNKEWIKNPLISSQLNIKKEIFNQMQLRRKNNNALGLANSLRRLGVGSLPSLWNELSNIKLPVFLLVGENDHKFLEIADKMIKKLPNCKKIIIPNAGHAAHLENMPFFVKVMLNLF